MIKIAKSLHKKINFETGDMMRLKYKDGYFGAVLAFYSIVHFTYPRLKKVLREVNRILKKDGQFLFSFHEGDEIIHLDTFLEKDVSIDFHFFKTERVIALLRQTGFEIITAAQRFPYEEAEYPSRRAYILCRKKK